MDIQLVTTGVTENGRWRQLRFCKNVTQAVELGNKEMDTETDYQADGWAVLGVEHEYWTTLMSSLPGNVEVIKDKVGYFRVRELGGN